MDKTNSTGHGNRFIDLTGQTFGQWTVLFEARKRNGHIYWRCRCNCGREFDVTTNALRQGRSKCCRHCRVTSHGLSRSTEYGVWRAMKCRCNLVTGEDFHNYGERGITVCKEWESFETFYRDMGPRPSSKHTLERIDNSLGYSPENCKWATRAEQLRNTRRNHNITFNGTTMCVADWSRYLGLHHRTLSNRINRGWPLEKALTRAKYTPARDPRTGRLLPH